LPLKVIELRQLAQIFVMFLIVQFSGLLLAIPLFSGASYQEITASQVISSPESALLYVMYIVVISALLLFVLKIYRGTKLFLIFEGVVVLFASYVVFSVMVSILASSLQSGILESSTWSFVAAMVPAVLLVIAKNRMPMLRNATAIIASVGVGLALGLSFGFELAFIFMAVLGIYDFIAVFVTKHMIALGNVAIQNNLSFLIMVRETKAVPMGDLSAEERKEYIKSKPMLEKQGGIVNRLTRENMAIVPALTALGTGDLAVPLMLAIAAYKVQLNFVLSFFIIFGSLLGLALNMLVLRKFKRALPAIPLLFAGIVIAMSAYYALAFVGL
jgi:presenilin-like A22 family membrane protease